MKSEKVFALIRAHLAGDQNQFRSVALQIAADEKRAGRSIGDRILSQLQTQTFTLSRLPTSNRNSEELFDRVAAEFDLGDLVMYEETRSALDAIAKEFRHAGVLAEHGLRPINRIMFNGPPGTGKTASAHALARAIDRPLLIARHGSIIVSYLGDTASNLEKVFDFAAQNEAVILFDEFDSFGQSRTGDKNDVGEMKRVLNVLLQLLERHKGPACIVCATNLPDSLDEALERRFDAVVKFDFPNESQRVELIGKHLGSAVGRVNFYGSHAQIVRECIRHRKRELLEGRC